jgi:hypothetical protein
MIHKITIENFFSIADPQELVLRVADNAPLLSCFQPSLSLPGERLPATVGLFGANASGKSTVLRALVALAEFAQASVTYGLESSILPFQPYMHKDWWNRPSKITIDFDGWLSGSPFLFRYEIHVVLHELSRLGKEVAYEALFYAPNRKFKRIFERFGQTVKASPEFGIKNNDPCFQSIRPNASVISTLGQLNHKLSSDFISLLKTVQANIGGLENSPPDPNKMLSYYAQHTECLKNFNRELRRLDVGIEEMQLESQGHQEWIAKFKHTGLDGAILMEEESSGTRRFIEIFLLLHHVLETGGIAVIDGIDANLHPLLLPEFFQWFTSPERNPKKAQLFFTAHNPSLLDDLEKEQVFFTEKRIGKPTFVYRASDIKGLRREPSLMNKYLGGTLGAVPHIG